MPTMLGGRYSSFNYLLPAIQQGGIFPILERKLISVERGQGTCPRTQKLSDQPKIQTKLKYLCLKLYFSLYCSAIEMKQGLESKLAGR